MIRLCLAGLVLVLTLCLAVARAGSISSTEIINKTAEATFACMQWTPVGLCFWLRCSYFECDVESSLKMGKMVAEFCGEPVVVGVVGFRGAETLQLLDVGGRVFGCVPPDLGQFLHWS